MKNKYTFILFLTFAMIYSAKAEDTIPKPKILDTLVILDGDRESRTINFIKWQLDSISASTDNFLFEDLKYTSGYLMMNVGYSQYLYKFNKTSKLYGSIGETIVVGGSNILGIPLNLNLVLGDIHCLDLGFGYSYLIKRGYSSYFDKYVELSGSVINFDVAYRYQYKFPRSKKPLPTGMMMKFGISTMYDLNNKQIFDKQFIICLYAGIGVPL